MTEKINEAQFSDIKKPEKNDSGSGLELSENEGLGDSVKSIEKIKEAIDHDAPLTEETLKQLKKALNSLTVDIGGEEFSLEKAKELADLKENIKIWEEIKNRDFRNIKKLSMLSNEVAEILSEVRAYIIDLRGLITLSDKQAEILVKHEGILDLSGLTTLSDKQAESLAKNKGSLVLQGLITLSDNQTKSLAKHERNLDLNGLTTLNDNQAESLAKHEGDIYANSKIKAQINKFKNNQ